MGSIHAVPPSSLGAAKVFRNGIFRADRGEGVC